MIEQVKSSVPLGHVGFRPFLYNVVMERRPRGVTRSSHWVVPETISYELPAFTARPAARETEVPIPESPSFQKLEIYFRGGNSFLGRRNAYAELVWSFERPATEEEFVRGLDSALNSLAVDLPREKTGVIPLAEIELSSQLPPLDLDPFRLEHHWLFEILMPCLRAQTVFVDGYRAARRGESDFLTNLFVEAIWHIKRCANETCVIFSDQNDELYRSLDIVNKLEG